VIDGLARPPFLLAASITTQSTDAMSRSRAISALELEARGDSPGFFA
jgi:hypothetical protein